MKYKEILELSAPDLKTLLLSLRDELCGLKLTSKSPSGDLKKRRSLRSSIAMILTRMNSEKVLKLDS